MPVLQYFTTLPRGPALVRFGLVNRVDLATDDMPLLESEANETSCGTGWHAVLLRGLIKRVFVPLSLRSETAQDSFPQKTREYSTR